MLLEAVISNRNAHRDLFIKAQEGYRKAVISELDRMLVEAREGKSIRRTITLPEPSDHTKDYDRVIRMLEMSTDETIDLKACEFDNYVMDNWEWKALAINTSAFYVDHK